jgi:hypothetical protein
MSYVHSLVKKALKSGELVRPLTCEACGKIRRTWAHHDDYLKPLQVRWLCKPCHAKWHAENGPGLNAELADLTPSKKNQLPEGEKPLYDGSQHPHFADMVQLIAAGSTLQQVAEKYGFTREWVRQIVGSPKLYRPTKAEMIRVKIESLKGQIDSLREQGKTAAQIASATGIPRYALPLLKKRPYIPKHGTVYCRRKGCRCRECVHAASAHSKRAIQKLRAAGRCVTCGKPSEGKRQCAPCYQKWKVKWSKSKGPRISKSGIKGIAWHEASHTWRVVRYENGKKIYYGTFKDLEKAKECNATIGERKDKDAA